MVGIRHETREVVVGGADDLLGDRVTLAECNWLAPAPAVGSTVRVQLRYRAAAVPAVVRSREADGIALDLAEPVRAITPGQSGVLYAGDDRLVLGGGVIEAAA